MPGIKKEIKNTFQNKMITYRLFYNKVTPIRSNTHDSLENTATTITVSRNFLINNIRKGIKCRDICLPKVFATVTVRHLV